MRSAGSANATCKMMIYKTLGILDLITVIAIISAAILPEKLLLYTAAYLLLKGLFFISVSNDFASYGDALSGVYMLLMVLGFNFPLATTAVLLYLGQKTFFTFVKIGIETYWLYKFIRQAGAKSSSPYYLMR